MKIINIPAIYEENIIGFVYDGVNVKISYHYEETLVNLIFKCVYLFDFCEFEYIDDLDWKFGLVEYVESQMLNDLFLRINSENRNFLAFGGEADKIRHFKLTIDDEGIYNIICKGFAMEQTPQ